MIRKYKPKFLLRRNHFVSLIHIHEASTLVTILFILLLTDIPVSQEDIGYQLNITKSNTEEFTHV